jgi:hypothetical protein
MSRDPGRTDARVAVALPPVEPARAGAQALLLLGGFAAAVVLRSAVGGAGVARSATAGLVFAGCLLALAAVVRWPRPGKRRVDGPGVRAVARLGLGLGLGLVGALVLCVPAVLHRFGGAELTVAREGFVGWAVVVLVVAGAEEVFLRGALFDLLRRSGSTVAVGIPAVAFALLHVPLYGWGAVPLDLAVGVWLGVLRLLGGSWTAPGVAHVLADWAAWWLV